MQESVALVLVAVGGLVAGNRSLDVAGAGEFRRGPLHLAVIAAAVALYFGIRHYGHAKLGLQLCIALLWVNASTVAFRKIRAGRAQLNGRDLATLERYAIAEAAGFMIGFAGVYLYLTR